MRTKDDYITHTSLPSHYLKFQCNSKRNANIWIPKGTQGAHCRLAIGRNANLLDFRNERDVQRKSEMKQSLSKVIKATPYA